ncbi:hypothetical protein AB7828_03390 [Tardiphaga sp. 215_C5_N2_1]|uniref:hypothetical protein n=1 Tax=Tardiphaga sp. 215_C5_N2_1 TaxID=3240774 RepID=UPI003F8AE274
MATEVGTHYRKMRSLVSDMSTLADAIKSGWHQMTAAAAKAQKETGSRYRRHVANADAIKQRTAIKVAFKIDALKTNTAKKRKPPIMKAFSVFRICRLASDQSSRSKSPIGGNWDKIEPPIKTTMTGR